MCVYIQPTKFLVIRRILIFQTAKIMDMWLKTGPIKGKSSETFTQQARYNALLEVELASQLSPMVCHQMTGKVVKLDMKKNPL